MLNEISTGREELSRVREAQAHQREVLGQEKNIFSAVPHKLS